MKKFAPLRAALGRVCLLPGVFLLWISLVAGSLTSCSANGGSDVDQGVDARVNDSPSVAYTDPPAGSFDSVKFREQANQRVRNIVACLRDASWPVKVTQVGQVLGYEIDGEIPQAQFDAWDAAIAQCNEQYPEVALPAPTPERGRRIYAYYLEMRDCLVERGYSVNSEPPTEEAFVDAYISEKSAWSPWRDVDPAQLDDADAACPQEPPPGVL